jgi:hypothetical protein
VLKISPIDSSGLFASPLGYFATFFDFGNPFQKFHKQLIRVRSVALCTFDVPLSIGFVETLKTINKKTTVRMVFIWIL